MPDYEKTFLRLAVACFLLFAILSWLPAEEKEMDANLAIERLLDHPHVFQSLKEHHAAKAKQAAQDEQESEVHAAPASETPTSEAAKAATVDRDVHVFVINLDSNSDRHFIAEKRIRDQPGFVFHHVPAVDGRAIRGGCGGPMKSSWTDVSEEQDTPGELDLECVTQSHVKAMVMGSEYLVDENDFILVMEDDVSFALRHFWRHQSLRRIAEGWSETHCDWSLVLLAPWLQDKNWANMYYHYLTESTNWQLLRKQRGDTFWGAAAYAINTKGLREVFDFLQLKPQHFPWKYDSRTGAPIPFFNLHASHTNYYCAAPRHGGVLPNGVNATMLSDCLIFDMVEASYISLPPLFVWDSSAIYSSTLHQDHEDAQGKGREKILEFALAVHDLDMYHHRICSVISGFATSSSEAAQDDAAHRCLHIANTAIEGVDDGVRGVMLLLTLVCHLRLSHSLH